MSKFFRGVAVPSFTFGLTSVIDGSAVTDGTVRGYISQAGGVQVELVNSAGGLGISHLGNGQWSVALTAEETDSTHIGLVFVRADAVNETFNLQMTNAPSPLDQTEVPGDPSTQIGKVRVLIADTEGAFFVDAEIQFFLDVNDDEIYYASALALDTMSTGAAQTAWMVRTGSTTQDFRRTPVELANAAQRMRDYVDDFPAYAVAEQNVSIFSASQILHNRYHRTEA